MTVLRVLAIAGLVGAGCNDSPVAPSVIGFTVAGSSFGNNVQAIAAATLSDGGTRNVGAECQWASSDTRVATVGTAGLVTAGSGEGQADIRATYAGYSVTTPGRWSEVSAVLRVVVEGGRVRLP